MPSRGGYKNRPRPRCDHCGWEGHTIATCYKLHGYPQRANNGTNISQPRGFVASSEQSSLPSTIPIPPTDQSYTSSSPPITHEQYNLILDARASVLEVPSENECWIIDSGATNHMCSTSHMLQTISPSTTLSKVQMPDGSTACITNIGSTSINSSLHLDNVFLIPSFKFNLLSVSQITKSLNCAVTFLLDRCFFQDLTTKRTIRVGSCWNGLYFMQSPTSLYATARPSFDIWHWRLGHPSASRSSDISALDSSVSFSNKMSCDVCPLGKHTRTPFPSSNTKSSFPFELIHCDIWGSFAVPSHSGARYFLTIVDDFSRCTWIFLMKHKSETQSFLKSFFALVANQYNTQIKRVQTENAPTITSDELY